MSDLLKHVDVYSLLDKIDENVFLTDAEHTIVWFNQNAKSLLRKVGPYVDIDNPDDFIGMNVSNFHGDRQAKILKEGPFPHSAHIVLFKKFSADILVDVVTDIHGETTGFILTWKDVTDYEETIKEGKELLLEIDTPIIPTYDDSAALVPVVGRITPDRLELIQEKILQYVKDHGNAFIIFDFTSFEHTFDPFELDGIRKIFKALGLMGVEPVVVGIGSKMAHSMIKTDIKLDVKPFNSFKQGMQYIMDKNGLKIIETAEKKQPLHLFKG